MELSEPLNDEAESVSVNFGRKRRLSEMQQTSTNSNDGNATAMGVFETDADSRTAVRRSSRKRRKPALPSTLTPVPIRTPKRKFSLKTEKQIIREKRKVWCDGILLFLFCLVHLLFEFYNIITEVG